MLIYNWYPVYVKMPPPDDRSGFTVTDQNILCIFGSPLYTYNGFGPATGSTPVPPTGGDMPADADGYVVPNGINPGSYLANPDGSLSDKHVPAGLWRTVDISFIPNSLFPCGSNPYH